MYQVGSSSKQFPWTCPAQAWYDMRPDHCQARTWSGEPPDPFWHDRPRSPIRSIPGAASPTIARPDVLHCFNLGVGSDLAAGALIAMCRMRLFPGRSIQSRLDEAFDRFSGWCSANNKSAAIPCFELKKFKMSSFLSKYMSTCFGKYVSQIQKYFFGHWLNTAYIYIYYIMYI